MKNIQNITIPKSNTASLVCLLYGIAREEGWLLKTARCRRNNNPGNIEWGPFAARNGATGTDGTFAIFATPLAGFSCMRVLLSNPAYSGKTIGEVITKWAPPESNNTEQYIANVCLWTGLTSETPLSTNLLTLPTPGQMQLFSLTAYKQVDALGRPHGNGNENIHRVVFENPTGR